MSARAVETPKGTTGPKPIAPIVGREAVRTAWLKAREARAPYITPQPPG